MWDPDEIAARLAPLAEDVAHPPARRAAVAILLREPQEPEVLLMQRVARAADPWSGQISLPGGGHEPQDPDLLATAIRETREEVGLDLARQARLLGRLPPHPARARGRRLDLDVTPFVFAAREPLDPRPLVEAEEVFWLPLVRVLRGELDRPFVYRRDDRSEVELPSWHFEGRTVWGMTHGILRAFFEALGPVQRPRKPGGPPHPPDPG
jgi:8-oxo-dGTP pyrophosphatase MutT (NUDIX family)